MKKIILIMKSIPVGNTPLDVAVNTNSNKVYVVNYGDDNVSVIDGKTNKWLKDIKVGKNPIRIDINPNVSKIYVTNQGSNDVSVINEVTDRIKNIPVGDKPFSVAVNSNTNKIHIGYSNSFEISVIDGISDELVKDDNEEEVKIPIHYACPSDIAINLEKNHSYVSFDCRDSIFLIKDSKNSTSTKANTLGKNNTNIAFNPNTNKIYVIDTNSNILYFKDVSEL